MVTPKLYAHRFVIEISNPSEIFYEFFLTQKGMAFYKKKLYLILALL